MTYELAKELKNAGFPQNFEPPFDFYYPSIPDKYKGDGYENPQHCSGQEVDSGCYGLGIYSGEIRDWAMSHEYDEQSVDVLIKIPTLSELIEACGDRFFFLEHRRDIPGFIFGWRAQEVGTDKGIAEGRAPLPEEAVARLWLALNKKA